MWEKQTKKDPVQEAIERLMEARRALDAAQRAYERAQSELIRSVIAQVGTTE